MLWPQSTPLIRLTGPAPEWWKRAGSLSALPLLSLWGLLFVSACAEDCPECQQAPSPTVDPDATPIPGFSDNHPSTFALRRKIAQQVLVYASPPLITSTTWYDQTAESTFLVTWEDLGDGRIAQHETLCNVELSEMLVATSRGAQEMDILVPEALVQHLSPDTWQLQLVEEGTPGDRAYSVSLQTLDSAAGPLFSVWGAVLADPLTQSCPSVPGEPEVDQDDDGNPGVTTLLYVDGDLLTETWICQRLLFRQGEAEVELPDTSDGTVRIIGDLQDVVVDQTQFGASYPLFPDDDPEVRWLEKDSFFELVSVPEGSGCSDIDPALFVAE